VERGLLVRDGWGCSRAGTRAVSDRPSHGLGSWRVRRAFLFGVVVFSGACVSYVLGADLKHRVAETVVEMAFVTITLSTGSYVFGAAWQDISTIRSKRRGQDDYYHRDHARYPEDPDGPI
jgi:hypothetical protein